MDQMGMCKLSQDIIIRCGVWQVLSALRVAWERGVLFTVCASVTTGREHVVAWRVPPPPASAAQYAAPAHPERVLRHSLARLHALLPQAPPLHD